MPQTDHQSLPPIIQDLMLDDYIQSMEAGLLHAEQTCPDDPLLPAGRAILYAMKHERQCRQGAYAAMRDADPDGVDALFADEALRRKGGHHEGV